MLSVTSQPNFPTKEILQKVSELKERMYDIPIINIDKKNHIANGIITVKNGLNIEFMNMVGEDNIFNSEILLTFGKFCFIDFPLMVHISGNGAKNYEIISENSLKF